MRRLIIGLTATALLTLTAGPSSGQESGAAALANAVALLRSDVPRVLYIAAHPDDEDPRLIAWLSRGGRAEVAYLSLTRGDGGQNLIGNELGDALGALRTQELLAARRIDGARQYFTRAYDFGYSKSTEETYTHWPRDSVLRDVIRVVRAFRPHVIVATFSGTPRDAHGQHQVSGQLARDAYDLAADTIRFPPSDLGAPWRPLKLYRNAAFNQATTDVLTMNAAEYDPLLGMSYDQISSRSRSQHKSQGVRENYRLGEVPMRYWREATRVNANSPRERERSILDGVAAALSPAGGDFAAEAAALAVDVRSPASAIRYISTRAPRAREESERYDRAAILAAALAFEATAPRQFVAVGDSIAIDFALYNRGTLTVRIDSGPGDLPRGDIAPGKSARWKGVLKADHKSEPWWLARPRAGDIFAVPLPATSDDRLAQAEWPRIKVRVAGLTRPLVMNAQPIYRLNEGFYGDIVAPVIAAPGVTVTPDPPLTFVRAGMSLEREVNVTIRSSFDSATVVTVRAELPPGLSAEPPAQDLTVAAGATRTVGFRVGGTLPAGEYRIRFTAEAKGQVFAEAVQVIDYPHVVRQQLYKPSDLRVTAVDVTVPRELTVGYVAGKADVGPRVLREMGIPVTLIEPAEIPRTDLSRFTTIVVGPRMYEASPDLVEHNGRLLDFARRGGRLVVQFGQYMMAGSGILPYRITISRPPDRVTDENAPVTITDPAAREMNHPNRIGPADFAGWVQERATFMPDELDARYRTMLAMNDPGEEPLTSSVLVAPLGSGTYVYTTLALFRQLEEGVPGAVRLLVNLLAP